MGTGYLFGPSPGILALVNCYVDVGQRLHWQFFRWHVFVGTLSTAPEWAGTKRYVNEPFYFSMILSTHKCMLE